MHLSPFHKATTIVLLCILSLSICEALYLPGINEVITSQENNRENDGSYNFGFKTSQGIEREEKGYYDSLGRWIVKGIVSWIAPDNKIYGYQYESDENGYRQVDMEPEDGDNRVDVKSKKGLIGGAL